MEPTRTVIKRLFAVSRNCCAFPECRVPIVEENGTVTGIICHIRARSRSGPRFDAKQSDEERHGFANLILMCARHSKIIDTEPVFYTPSKLQQFKLMHERSAENELSVADGRKVDQLFANYRDLYVHAKEVVIKRLDAAYFPNTKGPTVAAPEGSIGSDLLRRNYTKYLIDRYNHFASKQPARDYFAFPAIYKFIERNYRVKKWELVPMQYFDELCDELRAKIDRTMLGSINRGKGKPNYSDLAQYHVKYFARPPRRRGAKRASP